MKRKSQEKADATPPKHSKGKPTSDNSEPSTSASVSENKNEENPKDNEPKVNFLSMNDDSIYEVFDFLKLNDLCAMSQQCQRLYDLAENQFNRRFPKEAAALKLLMEKENILTYPDCSKQSLCFGNFERINLHYTAGNTEKSMAELNWIFENRAKESSIKELRFEKWLKLMPVHGQGLKDVIGKAESVVLSNTNVLGEFYETILKYTSSMEQLILWKSLKVSCKREEQSKWLLQRYPNLKNFAWHVQQELIVNKGLQTFFKQNETIEQFSLLSSNIQTIKQCAQYKIEITDLFFKVEGNVATTLKELKIFFGENTLKRLHLLFEDTSRSSLENSLDLLIELEPNIDGLYFEEIIINKKLATAISKLENLKILQVRGSEMVKKYLVDLPNLEELYIARPVKSGTFQAIHDTMLLFASRSTKLKKIYFRNNSQPFANFKFHEFDKERKKLGNAENLIIYVRTQQTDGTGLLSDIKLDYETLQIKRPRMEDIKNPLMDEFLYSIDTAFNLSYGQSWYYG